MKSRLLIVLSIALIFLFGCSNGSKILMPEGKRQSENKFETDVTKHVSLEYLLYFPNDYNQKDKVPLLLFLHGAGERGADLQMVKKHGPPKLIDEGKDLQFIVVSPQCPINSWWPNETTALAALIDDLCDKYNVDENRIYVTGLSMGGYGTWTLATENPNRFAAIMPICGGGDVNSICKIGKLPVWAFHGAKDPVVPVKESQNMVDKIKSCGGNAAITVYPEAGHDSWTETYNNPKVYEWLLSYSK